MTPIRYTNFDGLINSNTSDFLMRDNELIAAKNVWTYKLGKLEKVPGTTETASGSVGTDAEVTGLHWYFDTSDRVDYLLGIATKGDDLTMEFIAPNKEVPITSWTSIEGLSTDWDGYADSIADMENYLGKTFVVGHQEDTTFLPSGTVNGVDFSDADQDIFDMPQAKFIVRYRDLLYVLHTKLDDVVYPSRAYYSDEPVDGGIGWTSTDTNFIEFGYDDGDEITGAAEVLDRLIVFKERSMWKYDESERKKIADYGCDSHRSIQKINNVLYWFNRYGFWRWAGAYPELISAKMQNYIDAIDQANINNVISVQYDGFEYRAFIGDVTVDGTDYTNTWFCWDVRKETSYIRCTSEPAYSASLFKIDSKVRSHFGNDDSSVFTFANKVDNVYADNGEEIDSFFITKAYDHGAPEDVKHTNHMTVFSRYGEGIKCSVDINNNNSFDNTDVTSFDKNIGHADILSSGNRYRYKFYEKSYNKSWEFEGFVIRTEIKEQEL